MRYRSTRAGLDAFIGVLRTRIDGHVFETRLADFDPENQLEGQSLDSADYALLARSLQLYHATRIIESQELDDLRPRTLSPESLRQYLDEGGEWFAAFIRAAVMALAAGALVLCEVVELLPLA